MAITKVFSIKKNLKYTVSYASNEIKTSLNNVVQYAVNISKTEQRLFQSSLNCTLDNAYNEMMDSKKRWHKTDGVVGYHFIQSFKPGEVTAEQAHAIGIEFAERCFGDRFQVVIGTHLDRKHYHNHIVINSVSYLDGKKYHISPADYYNKIRYNSDKLCEENNLSVIKEPKGKGLHYAEWKAIKEGKPTIRGQFREELDEIIKASYTMRDFWRILQQRGYIIKRPQGKYKYPSVTAPYGKYPMRFDRLGKGYTLDDIQQRIEAQRNGIVTAAPSELPKKVYKLHGNIKNHKPKKLKGFIALYFHYLYFFKKIRKKQTPQRVSFFMREELTKMERYQKHFKFLNKYSIETTTDLNAHQKKCEDRIEELVQKRTLLYKERNDENCEEIQKQVAEIKTELGTLRSELRMCKAIYEEAQHITEKQRQTQELLQQAEKEVNVNEHKRRSR